MTSSLTFAFHAVQFKGNPFTNFLGINDIGIIVGFEGATNPTIGIGYNTVLGGNTPSTFAPPLTPAFVSLMAVGINNLGIADGIYNDANGVTHGWISTSTTAVDQPNTAFNQLLSINDFGITVGYSSDTKAGQVDQKAYIRSATAVYTDVNALLPTNVNSQATGIADSGEVVGFYLPTATTSNGFADLNGKIQVLQFPGSNFTQALGVNNSGEIVGLYNDAAGATHGFAYLPSTGLYTTADVPGTSTSSGTATVTATTVNSVNDQGTLSGFFTDSANNTQGFTATPVTPSFNIIAVQTAAAGILRTPLDLNTAMADAAQINAGTLGLPALQAQFISQAAGTEKPALVSYDWFFGATPSSGGLDFITSQAKGFVAAGFSTQNVWVNLGANFATASPAFTQTFGAMTNDQFIDAAYKDIFGFIDSPQAHAVYLASFNIYTTFVGQNGYTGAQTQTAARGSVAGVMLAEVNTKVTNTYTTHVANFDAAAANGTSVSNGLPIYGSNLRML